MGFWNKLWEKKTRSLYSIHSYLFLRSAGLDRLHNIFIFRSSFIHIYFLL